MPGPCCVPTCTNIGSHYFPKDIVLNTEWALAIGRYVRELNNMIKRKHKVQAALPAENPKRVSSRRTKSHLGTPVKKIDLQHSSSSNSIPQEVKLYEYIHKPQDRICKGHFFEEDFRNTLLGERARLKRYAVPSIFYIDNEGNTPSRLRYTSSNIRLKSFQKEDESIDIEHDDEDDNIDEDEELKLSFEIKKEPQDEENDEYIEENSSHLDLNEEKTLIPKNIETRMEEVNSESKNIKTRMEEVNTEVNGMNANVMILNIDGKWPLCGLRANMKRKPSIFNGELSDHNYCKIDDENYIDPFQDNLSSAEKVELSKVDLKIYVIPVQMDMR